MGTARPLAKLNSMTEQERIASLERRLVRAYKAKADAEKRAVAAEQNANRFHALMLKARIDLINAKAKP